MTYIPTKCLLHNFKNGTFSAEISELSAQGYQVANEIGLVSDRTGKIATFVLRETTSTKGDGWTTMEYVPTVGTVDKFRGLKGYNLKFKVFGGKWSSYVKNKISGKNNYRYGKHLSDDDKRKLSKTSGGKNNFMYGKSVYDVWLTKYGKEIADKKLKAMREKMSQNHPDQFGLNNPIHKSKYVRVASFVFQNINTNQKIKINNLSRWCLDNNLQLKIIRKICNKDRLNKSISSNWKCIKKSKQKKMSKIKHQTNPYYKI